MTKLIFAIIFNFFLVRLYVAQTPTKLGNYPKDLLKNKLNKIDAFECIHECSSYVSTDDCGSICNQNVTQFQNLMSKVSGRFNKESLCDVDMSRIPLGFLNIPLMVDTYSGKCTARGLLILGFNNISTETESYSVATYFPNYKLTVSAELHWSGLTIYCTPATSTIKPAQFSMNLEIKQHYASEQNYQFTKGTILTTYGYMSSFVTTTLAPQNLPQYTAAIENSISNLLTSYDVMQTFNSFLSTVFSALLNSCIMTECSKCK